LPSPTGVTGFLRAVRFAFRDLPFWRKWSQGAGLIVLTILGLGVAGCSSVAKHTVEVEAEARPKAEGSISYQLISTNPAIEKDTLRHKEAVRMVKTTLAARGMYESPDPAQADMVVDIDYGVSPRLVRQETVRQPIVRRVQGPSIPTTVVAGEDKDGNPVYKTVNLPGDSTEVIEGFRDAVVEVGYYEKRLVLTARENRPGATGQPGEELWSVELLTSGPSRDLRKILPVLAGAGIDFIGKDTGGKVQVRIKENDGAIEFVKQGLEYAAHRQ
jgi:hypothetical protein